MNFKFWNRPEPKEERQKVGKYDDRLEPAIKVGDHQLYMFKNVALMSKFRGMAYAIAFDEYVEKISHIDIGIFCDLFNEFVNEGNQAEANNLVGFLKTQLILDHRRKPLYGLANAFILLEGEPIDKITPEYTEKKKDLCEKYPELDAFFLKYGLISTNNLTDSSDIGTILTYLQNPNIKAIEEAFLQSIGKSDWNLALEG